VALAGLLGAIARTVVLSGFLLIDSARRQA
jgi:hypothetical protein